ncbi:MAG: histidine phosphatase family protein [Acidobacteria bacterium]|nr:histidine phosphatase family protein [Acidobacteriota bacterium]
MIHLIRHARPSVTGVLLGWADVPLADVDVSPFTIDVQYVITSPLLRARRTAELIFPGRQVDIVPALMERGLGDWENLRWSEVEAKWPDLAAKDWFSVTPPNGESWGIFEDRVRTAWLSMPKCGNVAVVAHAGVNALLHHFITRSDVATFHQDYLETISLAIPN